MSVVRQGNSSHKAWLSGVDPLVGLQPCATTFSVCVAQPCSGCFVMRNLKMTLQYDGTNYVGWQRQATGTSIQGLLEDAFEPIAGTRVTVHGAGRTDAGSTPSRRSQAFHFPERSNPRCWGAR